MTHDALDTGSVPGEVSRNLAVVQADNNPIWFPQLSNPITGPIRAIAVKAGVRGLWRKC